MYCFYFNAEFLKRFFSDGETIVSNKNLCKYAGI